MRTPDVDLMRAVMGLAGMLAVSAAALAALAAAASGAARLLGRWLSRRTERGGGRPTGRLVTRLARDGTDVYLVGAGGVEHLTRIDPSADPRASRRQVAAALRARRVTRPGRAALCDLLQPEARELKRADLPGPESQRPGGLGR